MASRGVSTLKFVGTVSLGLLTVSPSSCQFVHPHHRVAQAVRHPRTWAVVQLQPCVDDFTTLHCPALSTIVKGPPPLTILPSRACPTLCQPSPSQHSSPCPPPALPPRHSGRSPQPRGRTCAPSPASPAPPSSSPSSCPPDPPATPTCCTPRRWLPSPASASPTLSPRTCSPTPTSPHPPRRTGSHHLPPARTDRPPAAWRLAMT